jgi:hypothetical protein
VDRAAKTHKPKRCSLTAEELAALEAREARERGEERAAEAAKAEAAAEAAQPYEAVALGFMSRGHWLRRRAITWISSNWFNNLSLACIVVNSVTMGVADHSHADPATYELTVEGSLRNYVVNGIFEVVFLVIFTAEMAVKIVGKGFLCGKKAYLQVPWGVGALTALLTALSDGSL